MEDVEFLKETGETPQRAALRLGKTCGALEKAMRTAHRKDLSNWLNRIYEANCAECDKPIRGRQGKAEYTGLCAKCAVRAAKGLSAS